MNHRFPLREEVDEHPANLLGSVERDMSRLNGQRRVVGEVS
jgi:hypothetical protein